MGAFRYVSAREVDARHSAVQRPSVASPRGSDNQSKSQQRNVKVVLSLGDTQYITFHKQVFGIPPVPFKLGQQILDLQIRITGSMKQLALYGKSDVATTYYRDLTMLARIMWKHLRVVSHWRRMFKRLHLLRNPLSQASEQELLDMTNFFLQCRMKSSVQSFDQEISEPSTRMS